MVVYLYKKNPEILVGNFRLVRMVQVYVSFNICLKFLDCCAIPGGVLGIQVKGMIKWSQKSRPQKIYPFPHLIFFNTPKKSLLKSSYPSQIFVPKKIAESKISNPTKSFDHPRHLKSRVPTWVRNARQDSSYHTKPVQNSRNL